MAVPTRRRKWLGRALSGVALALVAGIAVSLLSGPLSAPPVTRPINVRLAFVPLSDRLRNGMGFAPNPLLYGRAMFRAEVTNTSGGPLRLRKEDQYCSNGQAGGYGCVYCRATGEDAEALEHLASWVAVRQSLKRLRWAGQPAEFIDWPAGQTVSCTVGVVLAIDPIDKSVAPGVYEARAEFVYEDAEGWEVRVESAPLPFRVSAAHVAEWKASRR